MIRQRLNMGDGTMIERRLHFTGVFNEWSNRQGAWDGFRWWDRWRLIVCLVSWRGCGLWFYVRVAGIKVQWGWDYSKAIDA